MKTKVNKRRCDFCKKEEEFPEVQRFGRAPFLGWIEVSAVSDSGNGVLCQIEHDFCGWKCLKDFCGDRIEWNRLTS